MKAAVWHRRNDIRVEEVPEPGAPGPGEVIIRVGACGICGTDLEEYRDGPLFIPVDEPNPLTGRKAPLILGHEFAGEVVDVGRGVVDFKLGDRIAPDVLIYCGECYWCRRHQVNLCEKLAALGLMGDGGLAEYCRMSTAMCIALPNGLGYDHAALAEPLSVSVRAIRKGEIQPGARVAIFGGGTIGQLALQSARVAGAGEVFMVEPLASRRQLAMDFGASTAIDPTREDVVETLRRLTRGVGPDLVVEASGNANAVASAIAAARKGGRIVLVGLPVKPTSLNFFEVVAAEKEIVGSLSHVYDEDYATAIRWLGDGRVVVDPLISVRLPLDRLLEDGLHRLEARTHETLKVIVVP
ncbi:MAG: alcohol dehydrogenase catalytic domain-containing protein [Caldilineaceae bacterium]|nr:alcohol dehydrogenase catalytic domain-containing protein [Caldilineaceae bacterium]